MVTIYRVMVVSLKIIMIFLILYSDYICECKIDEAIADSYLEAKFIRKFTICGCYSKTEKLQILRRFALKDKVVNLINIDRDSIEPEKRVFFLVGFILDAHCRGAGIFLAKVAKKRIFGRKYRWLVMSPNGDFAHKFHNLSVNVDSDVNIVYADTRHNSSERWTVLEAYNPLFERGGSLRINEIGFYDRQNGYQAGYKIPKYMARRDLSEITMKSVVVLLQPFSGSLKHYLENNEDPGKNSFDRFHHRINAHCQFVYNHSVDVAITKSWGYKNPDGTFDGLAGGLERRELDFGSSPLYVRADRAKVIDYGKSTWLLRTNILFRNPKTISPSKIFLSPLSPSIWFSIIVCSVLSVLVLKLLLSFDDDFKNYANKSWISLTLFIISVFAGQGSLKLSNSVCVRIVIIFNYFLALFMYQCYLSSIVAHLLMTPSQTITSVEGLVQSSMKVGCQDILYERDYFQNTKDKWPRELYLRKIMSKDGKSNFLTPEEGLKKVAEGNYAFEVELSRAYPIIEKTFSERIICEIVEVHIIRNRLIHANYQKDSPIRDMMEICLLHQGESGILTRETEFWHPKKPHCVRSSNTIIFNVAMEEFYPALAVLAVGMLLSLVILVLEIIFSFEQKRRNAKKALQDNEDEKERQNAIEEEEAKNWQLLPFVS